MFREAYAEDPHSDIWSAERAFAYLSRIYHFDPELCYIAEEHPKIIGTLFGYTFPWSSGIDLFIQELFVKQAYRQKGV